MGLSPKGCYFAHYFIVGALLGHSNPLEDHHLDLYLFGEKNSDLLLLDKLDVI